MQAPCDVNDEQLELLRKYLSKLRDPGRARLTLAVVVDLVLFASKVHGRADWQFRDPRQ